MKKSAKEKVIILHNIISPIRVFLFNQLNKYYQKKGTEFKVFFLSVSDKNRNWKTDYKMNFDYEILDNFAIRIAGKDLNTFFINPKITKALKKEKPDRVISFGWDNYAVYAANRWCRKNKKQFILWSGSTKYEKSWRRTFLKPLVRYLIKKTDNFIAYGTRAKEYFISLGINPKKIQIIYNTVDIDYFREKSKNFSEEKKAKFKKELGIKTDKILLFSGQLIERKGVFELLEGFKKYQKIDPNISLLILGKGQEKKKMEKIIQEKSIHNVVFANFVQYNNLYKYYSISDLLILPSREEVWGLVINEAMACGLPVITTHETGASVDLVEEGKNGYVIPSNNLQAIAKSIQKVFSNNLHKDNNSWQIVQKTRVEDILKEVKI
jgi:glycosyltransferase involved in cell wall biosynthesis